MENSLRSTATMAVAANDPYCTQAQKLHTGITIIYLFHLSYSYYLFFFCVQGDNRGTADPYDEHSYICNYPGLEHERSV